MWEKCGINQAFDPERRLKAMARQHELFKKPVGDGTGIASDSFLDSDRVQPVTVHETELSEFEHVRSA